MQQWSELREKEMREQREKRYQRREEGEREEKARERRERALICVGGVVVWGRTPVRYNSDYTATINICLYW